MGLKTIVNKFLDGFKINNIFVYAQRLKERRLKEETRLQLYLKQGTFEHQLLNISVNYGLKPYYRPWIQLSNISTSIRLETSYFYYDSPIEDYLLKVCSNPLKAGGNIFIEYANDKETSYGLVYSFPPAVTRLGYKLFSLGFTWFKDWYFSEGGYEVGEKSQGEKPLNEESKNARLKEIYDSIQVFLNQIENYNKEQQHVMTAVDRGEQILKNKY
jgi:hypothetical protein